MQVTFRNFGPIASGELTLKPLTVLIGPNQSGKSFAATAVYAFLRALGTRGVRGPYQRLFFEYEGFPTLPPVFGAADEEKDSRRRLEEIRKKLVRSEVNRPITISKDQTGVLDLIGPTAQLKAAIRAGFQETFAAAPSELARAGADNSSVHFKHDEFFVGFDLRTLDVQTASDLERVGPIHLGYGDKRRRDYEQPKEGETILFRPSARSSHQQFDMFYSDLRSEVYKISRRLQIADVPSVSDCLYVPAIRSGLLLSHRLFLSLLLRNVSRAGIAPLAIPQMTGVVADFLQALIAIPDRERWPEPPRHGLHDLIKSAETQLAGGTVYYEDRGAPDALPNLRYKSADGLRLPLNLTSSAVTEVAPLFLLLRTITRRNPWVIVEEPEAHLSPENQRHMAEFLVNLVRRGVKLIVTTHSSFLMEQLNNAIAAHTHRQTKDTTPPLSHEDVAAYMVGPWEKAPGTEIRPLIVDASDGIDVSAFTKAYEELYEQSFRIKGAGSEA